MSTDHLQPDLASNAASFTSASPTFTPYGSRLAWAEKDGVHFANTSDLRSCSATTGALPDTGRTDGHQRGENMAAVGENRWPPLGRNRWPLTD